MTHLLLALVLSAHAGVTDELSVLPAADSTLARDIATAEPVLARNGQPRFTDPAWVSAGALRPLLARVASGDDSADVKVALLGVVSRIDGDWGGAVVALAAEEADPAVRRMLVEILGEASVDHARAGLSVALSDGSEAVRLAAMRALGAHEDGAQLGDLAVLALADDSVVVREEAARAIGYCGYVAGFEALRAALGDNAADVRHRALRSLQKLDAPRTAALPELSRLAGDADPRITREVARLRGE